MSLGLMLAVLPPPPAHERWIVVGTTDYNSQWICGNGTVKYQTKMHMYRVKCTVPLIYDELLRLQPAYPKDVINIFKDC